MELFKARSTMLPTCLNHRNKIEGVGAAPRPLHDVRLDTVSAPGTSYLRTEGVRNGLFDRTN